MTDVNLEDAERVAKEIRHLGSLAIWSQYYGTFISAAALLRKIPELRMQWQPIETAPDGEPGWDVGSREPGPYFLGLVDQKYSKTRRYRIARKRCSDGYAFCDIDGDTYYVYDFFTHWMPLPGAPQ
jgi:hypothetical protein